MGISYVFLLTYIPDFNPVDRAFNKIKLLLKAPEYEDLVSADLHVAIQIAVSNISESDCKTFFKYTNIINM